MKRSTTEGAVFERRRFLQGAGTAVGVVLAGCATGAHAQQGKGGGEVEISPGEDLMQEHGIVLRILLIYEEAARRLELGAGFDPATVVSAAGIIRRFVEDYHEQNEELFVFPRLQAAGREAQLVATLLTQHQRGRQATDAILQGTRTGATSELARDLRGFSRMYHPHMGWEDTVVFPAFREVVGPSGYHELGEQFEQREHQLVGEHGFEQTVAEVTRLEQTLNMADLASYTMP